MCVCVCVCVCVFSPAVDFRGRTSKVVGKEEREGRKKSREETLLHTLYYINFTK